MNRSLTVGKTTLRLFRDDITRQDTDAIVNAANSTLMGGGGVDGAIHRAGGPQILKECMAIRARQGDLPTGEAVLTSGGNLRAKFVIHTVGPIWRGGKQGEDELLCCAYRSSLELARRHGLSTIAFPSISTGIYGFPIERASRIALETVRQFVLEHQEIREVRFIVFSKDDEQVCADLFANH
jgi:O-acetyl-ADP-ribose deacetylase (regulator of RNase III)